MPLKTAYTQNSHKFSARISSAYEQPGTAAAKLLASDTCYDSCGKIAVSASALNTPAEQQAGTHRDARTIDSCQQQLVIARTRDCLIKGATFYRCELPPIRVLFDLSGLAAGQFRWSAKPRQCVIPTTLGCLRLISITTSLTPWRTKWPITSPINCMAQKPGHTARQGNMQ